jgi:hypothetical protein
MVDVAQQHWSMSCLSDIQKHMLEAICLMAESRADHEMEFFTKMVKFVSSIVWSLLEPTQDRLSGSNFSVETNKHFLKRPS